MSEGTFAARVAFMEAFIRESGCEPTAHYFAVRRLAVPDEPDWVAALSPMRCTWEAAFKDLQSKGNDEDGGIAVVFGFLDPSDPAGRLALTKYAEKRRAEKGGKQ